MNPRRKENRTLFGTAVLWGLLLLFGCAETGTVKKPLPEVDRPAMAGAEPKETRAPEPRLSPLVDPPILKGFQKEIDRDLASLDKLLADLSGKDPEGKRKVLIEKERERLHKRKGMIEEIQRIQGELERTEGFEEQERIQKGIARALMELSRVYPRFTLEPFECPPPEEPSRKLQDLSKEVDRAYREGRYGDVVLVFERFRGEHPKIEIPPEVLSRYAISLQKKGNTAMAIDEMKAALKSESLKIDSYLLRYLLATWLSQMGRNQEAIEVYKALSQELEKRKKWGDLARVKVRMLEVGKDKTALRPERKTGAPAEAHAQEEGEEEEEAPGKPSVEPPVRMALPRPEEPARPGVRDEDRTEMEKGLLEEGNRLLEKEDFERAIKIYQKLQGTAYEEEGRKQIQEAMDRFANKKRKEASELFLRALKTADPEKKKDLLLKSLSLLKEANRKFPDNRYADKVRANIKSVIDEIRKIVPDFKG